MSDGSNHLVVLADASPAAAECASALAAQLSAGDATRVALCVLQAEETTAALPSNALRWHRTYTPSTPVCAASPAADDGEQLRAGVRAALRALFSAPAAARTAVTLFTPLRTATPATLAHTLAAALAGAGGRGLRRWTVLACR